MRTWHGCTLCDNVPSFVPPLLRARAKRCSCVPRAGEGRREDVNRFQLYSEVIFDHRCGDFEQEHNATKAISGEDEHLISGDSDVSHFPICYTRYRYREVISIITIIRGGLWQCVVWLRIDVVTTDEYIGKWRAD